MGTGQHAGLGAEAASLWGSAWAGEPPLCPSELGGAIPWLSITHTQQTYMHMYTHIHTCAYIHTHLCPLQTHTPTCTSHTQPLQYDPGRTQ